MDTSHWKELIHTLKTKGDRNALYVGYASYHNHNLVLIDGSWMMGTEGSPIKFRLNDSEVISVLESWLEGNEISYEENDDAKSAEHILPKCVKCPVGNTQRVEKIPRECRKKDCVIS